MKVAKLLLINTVFYLISCHLHAQVSDNFSDGDFSGNPVWTGTPESWIINSGFQLQSNNTVTNSTFYITTPNTLATSAEWMFSVHLNFNTSSANYADVFIIASDNDLVNSNTSGYFVRIGNTDDEISLYRKDRGGTITKIIDGANGTTNRSGSNLIIRIIRNVDNEFQLFYKEAEGGSFISESKVVDNNYLTSAYFGFLVKQSTSSFFQKHSFDNIVIQNYVPDVIPPAIQSVIASGINTLDVLFSEPVESNSVQTVSNFYVHEIGNPQLVQLSAPDNSLVHLIFNNNFKSDFIHTLAVSHVKDIAGNSMSGGSATFSYHIPLRFDVIMDEIMADPVPVTGLPNAEYIELKNMSGRDINLKDWKLLTSSSVSGAFPSYIFPADSFLIVTSSTNATALTIFGNAIGIGGFPSLNNEGTTIALISKEGATIHSVSYNAGWYGNKVKSEGGWSLEMMDTHYPCSGQSNWKASTHLSGGSPGRKNSVDGMNKDEDVPVVLNAVSPDSTTIILVFDEPVDSLPATETGHYHFMPAVNIDSVSVIKPDFTQVRLKLSSPIAASTVYTLTVSGVTDCTGNGAAAQNSVLVGWPKKAAMNDVVINEILFNPKPSFYDFVEFFNRSDKVIDAAQLYVANRNGGGAVSSLKRLSEKPYYIFPGEYVVITEDALSLQQAYLVKNIKAVLTLSSLPSLPDDKGSIVLLNAEGDVIDEVTYSKNWHFGLMANDNGISLERIDPDAASQNRENWHSAASTAGYGTPTYKNSQYKQTDNINAAVEVMPQIFSPDNDGYEDMATISYQLSESGYVANILIFDVSGRLVRSLVKNEILGLKGKWNWDGLDEKKQKLPMGSYIVYTELFNLKGKKKQFKNVVVLARKF